MQPSKYAWIYPLKTRDEFIEKLRDLIDVKLKSHGVKIKHYHADGGAELISKLVLTLLKREGARYTWNPAETPELNSNSERRFRTLGERTLSKVCCCDQVSRKIFGGRLMNRATTSQIACRRRPRKDIRHHMKACSRKFLICPTCASGAAKHI